MQLLLSSVRLKIVTKMMMKLLLPLLRPRDSQPLTPDPWFALTVVLRITDFVPFPPAEYTHVT